MTQEAFRLINLRPKARALIERCNEIIASYQAQDLRLTLRQLYYQLVSANVIPNVERSYKNLSSTVSDARLAGLMDWDAIEDRVRRPRRQSEFEDLGELVTAALASYRLPRWEGQENYVELWVEKDALAGVLEPLASEFHVTMMVNRGYSSQSAMYEAANRFNRACEREDGRRQPIIFYLGDHDPSGEDMVRDVEERLQMFSVHDIDVRKLALTMAQIRSHRPPPNPAKVTDPRASAYIERHGESSWEVDALPPNVLARIIRDAFRSVVDRPKMEAIKAREKIDKAELQAATAKLLAKRGGK